MKPPIATSSTQAASPQKLPPHPSEWIGKSGLVPLVKDAIQRTEWKGKGRDFAYHGQTFPSLVLMTLEVYCYARGIFCSWEVGSYLNQDPFFRELFPGELPAPELIRRFRREHHGALKACLLQIFEQAFFARFGDTAHSDMLIDSCVAQALDRWFEPITGPRPETEAAQRIDQAIFWDGMKVSELEG
ncbi:MAG TPA: hypothetical protein VNU68_29240 [Verrucomicrobiae bacterium]|jgi:hypothetical protein|nr:hypothetical protein [Verrucomicrobiae bacterium]